MDSPQLTMESVEVSTTPGGGDQVEQDVEMVVPPRQQQEQQQYYGSPHPGALGKVDVDENDDTGDAAPSRQQHDQDMTGTTMSAPSSGFSLISAKSTDQVLDLPVGQRSQLVSTRREPAAQHPVQLSSRSRR